MLSYGGVGLFPHPPAGLILPPAEAFGFFRKRRLGESVFDPRSHFNWFLNRGVRLNTFHNPWGASRWGTAYVLANQAGLDAIRLQVYGEDANEYNALPFVMSDAASDLSGQTTASLTTDLWMMPAYPIAAPPLNSTDPGQQAYLLVLVDDRFFWWEKAASITITEKTTTWAVLYDSIADSLEIDLDYDAIAAAYLSPGSGLAQKYEYLPLLLDWAAACVGQRLVRKLDGTFIALSAASAKTLMNDQAGEYVKLAGGLLDVGVIE